MPLCVLALGGLPRESRRRMTGGHRGPAPGLRRADGRVAGGGVAVADAGQRPRPGGDVRGLDHPNLDQWVLFARDPYGPAPIEPGRRFHHRLAARPAVAHTSGRHPAHLRRRPPRSRCPRRRPRRAGPAVRRRPVTSALVVLLFVSAALEHRADVARSARRRHARRLGARPGVASGGRPRAVVDGLVGRRRAQVRFVEQGLAAVAVLAALVWFADRLDRDVGGRRRRRAGARAPGRRRLPGRDDVPTCRADWAGRSAPRCSCGRSSTTCRRWRSRCWASVGSSSATPPVRPPALRAPPAPRAGGARPGRRPGRLDETRVASMVIWPAAVWMVRQGDADREGGLDDRSWR